MSFLVGSLAGAVATGGVYYGFSNLIQTKTAQHRNDLHFFSERLANASAMIPGPLPASARIVERPFMMMLQSRWNEHVANIFLTAGRWEGRASDWTRKVLYGEVPSSSPSSSSSST